MTTEPKTPNIAATMTYPNRRSTTQRRRMACPRSLYQLEEYMRYGAAREGLPWQLDVAFLHRHYGRGVRTFLNQQLVGSIFVPVTGRIGAWRGDADQVRKHPR